MGKTVDDYVDEIVSMVKNVSRDEIKNLFNQWIKYGYSPEVVKEKILQRYKPEEKLYKIGDLKKNMENVNIIGKIISLKEYTKDGKKYYLGSIGDDTGTITFMSFLPIPFERGTTILLKNARTGIYKDSLRIYISEKSSVEKSETKIEGARKEYVIYTVERLNKNSRNVDITLKVLYSEPVQGKDRTIYKGIAGDTTGLIQFTSWKGNLEKNKTYRIRGAYVNEFKGSIYLNINENTEVTETNKEIEIRAIPLSQAIAMNLNYAYLEGFILGIKNIEQVKKCPVCGRTLSDNVCPVHGNVDPKFDVKASLIFDDGSDVAFIVLYQEQIKGKMIEEYVKDMVLKPYTVFGKISKKNNITIFPIEMNEITEDYVEIIKNELEAGF